MREPPLPPQRMHVAVEVVLLSLDADGRLAYRLRSGPVEDDEEPDGAVLRIAGLGAQPSGGTVSHSTSWRCPGPGRLLLTYAVLPDPRPQGAVLLEAPSIMCSADPLRPTPPDLHTPHVVAHAARHLAYLAATDPTVAAAALEVEVEDLWSALRAQAMSAPVAEHDLAHEMSRRQGASAGSPRPGSGRSSSAG